MTHDIILSDEDSDMVEDILNTREPPAWAIAEAREHFYNTEFDGLDLDLMEYGYDADAAAQIYWALDWLHHND